MAHDAKVAKERFANLFNPLRELNALFTQVDDFDKKVVERNSGKSIFRKHRPPKSVCISVAPEKNKPTVAMKKLIEREMRREERGAAQLERMTADTPPPRTPLTPATTVGSPSMQRGGSSMSAIFGRRSVQNFFSGKNSRGASSGGGGGGEASRRLVSLSPSVCHGSKRRATSRRRLAPINASQGREPG